MYLFFPSDSQALGYREMTKYPLVPWGSLVGGACISQVPAQSPSAALLVRLPPCNAGPGEGAEGSIGV